MRPRPFHDEGGAPPQPPRHIDVPPRGGGGGGGGGVCGDGDGGVCGGPAAAAGAPAPEASKGVTAPAPKEEGEEQRPLEGAVRAVVLSSRPERLAHFEGTLRPALREAAPFPAVDAARDPAGCAAALGALGLTLAPFWAAQATAGQV